MASSDYFVWNADPMIFDSGALSLPFPVSILGLIAAIAALYFLLPGLFAAPDSDNDQRKSRRPAWQRWGIIIGAVVVGQFIFVQLNAMVITQIGPLQPRWYGLLFASAFIFGYWMMFKMYRHAALGQDDLDRLLFYVLIATVIGARLGHVIFYDLEMYLRNPGEILAIWHGGLASHGAAIGIILAMYLYVKKYAGMDFLWLADRVVVVVASGGAFIRIGNFVNSEIVGKATDLPWAIIFPRAYVQNPMLPRHPTMLYEALLCIIVFAILWTIYKRYRHHPPQGALFGTFLVILFGGRFLLEYTKINQAAFTTDWAINMGQWLSVPLILAGLWLLFSKVNWSKRSTYSGSAKREIKE